MKKLLFSAVTLDVGGIETALITLLNYLANQKEDDFFEEQKNNDLNNRINLQEQDNKYEENKINNKYEITLVLEKKQGLFLDVLDKNIKVIEYTPNNSKIVIIRKAINLLKQIIFKAKYKNKYDFACSYASYSNPTSFVARTASENSAIWCHLDYLAFFEGNKEAVKAFFEEKHYKEFKHIITVSQRSKETFLEVFPEEKDKTIHINNLIDFNKILCQSKEEVQDISEIQNIKSNQNTTIFINIGRHEEKQKRLSKIIEAAKLLKEKTDNKFIILFVGDGADTDKYKQLVEKYNLKNEILFLGRKKNPYPYLKMADCSILTSDYEGYPVVFVESMTLNKPIITTNVSGVEAIEKEGYAIITKNDVNSIYETMKKFIDDGFEVKSKFNPEQYNKEILEKLEKIF